MPKTLKQENIADCPFKNCGYCEGVVMSSPVHEDVLMGELPPFLRTLIVTDGTVTKTLEAYYWEPVCVDTLDQGLKSSDSLIECLQVSKGDEVLLRDVLLRGERSGKIYASASSVIVPDAIPVDLRNRLLDGVIGIGVLIRDCGLESYRELLTVGAAEKMTYFHISDRDSPRLAKIVYRTYRILLAGRPAIMITEMFPCEMYDQQ